MSLISQAIRTPKRFEMVQLVRIVNRYTMALDTPFELEIKADPIPDNSHHEVADFAMTHDSSTITSALSSLSSGETAVPSYIYEALLGAFHQEDYALADFLDIFNSRHFKLYARTIEKSHLLLSDEFDRYMASKESFDKKNYTDLMSSMMQLAGLGLRENKHKWLSYSLLLGLGSRNLKTLQNVLQDYFQVTLELKVKNLSRHQLNQESWTTISSDPDNRQNNQLGRGFLLGKQCYLAKNRIWSVVSADSSSHLQALLNDKKWYLEMASLIRTYLRDKTEIGIYLQAPVNWFQQSQISNVQHKTVRLGRGFHLRSTKTQNQITHLIHLAKD